MDDWSLLDEADILSRLPEKFEELLESKKWTERRDALNAMLAEIAKTPRLDSKADYHTIAQQLRSVLAKDANINVCALAAKCITGLSNGLRMKFTPFVSSFFPVVIDRFKEKKPTLRDPLIECVDALALRVNMDTLAEELCECIDKPNPNIKVQSCNFIFRVMKNYAVSKEPKKFIKAILPLLVKFASDSDSDVRDAACLALGSVMRLTGEKVMNNFLGSLKEDKVKLKKISDGRDQAVAEFSENEEKRQMTLSTNGASSVDANKSGRSGNSVTASKCMESEVDPWDMLTPVDVLSKLPSSFNEGIESKKWQERRDALQSLLVLCTDNPRLCQKANYGEHVALLKKILEKDANINVCATSAKCITALANGLRKKFAQYSSLVAAVIFEKFKEKKPVLRDPLIDCIDAVSETTTLEALAEEIQIALEKQNPNIKIQTNLFLYRVFKRYTLHTAPKKTLKTLSPFIVKHTSDPDPEVRDASYAALGAAMKAVGEKSCLVLLADIIEDKTKMTKIKDFCEKALQEAGTDVVSVMVQSIHKSNFENSTEAGSGNSNSISPLKPPAPGVGNKSSTVAKESPNETIEEIKETENFKETDEKTKPKDECLAVNKEKIVRLRDERNLKLLKWNFDQPNADHVEQLKTLMGGVCQANLLLMLYNKDFKQQLKAIESINSLATDNPEAVICNSDLLLKWVTLRFFETNPTVLLKVLDLTQTVFGLILQHNETFTDQELNSFLPYLILKLGEPKDSVRTSVRAIIQLITEIVSPPKVFPLVLEGLKTKNSRQRTECLQVLEMFLESCGMAATATPAPSLKQIAACIGDRDNNVRNAAINAMVVAWKEDGDRVFQMVGKMNDKDKALLDERIKRSGAVSKAKGAPERVLTTVIRRNANIAVGIKGRNMRGERSTSRPGRSGQRSFSVSRDSSPVDDRETDKTFTMQAEGADADDDAKTSRKRFALDFSLLRLDNEEDSATYGELNAEKLEILEPIEPAVRQRNHSVPIAKRAESVSSLTSLESAAGDVDKVVHAVASVSQSTANAAISQLQFIFGDTSNFRYMIDRTEAVVQAIVTQSSIIRSRHLNDFSAFSELNELLRTICHFLSSLIREPLTCSRISSESLKMLIQEFLYLLKDERMKRLNDTESIFRSLNYLTIRICDNADPTACFIALCLMLRSALHDPTNNTIGLIIKCIYKQSELFMRNISMDLNMVVKALHDFMQEFKPRVDENDSISDSIRCMELCMQRLVTGTNGAILQNLVEIRDLDSSEAVVYLKKCVRCMQNKSNQSSLASSAYGELPGQVVANNDETLKILVNSVIDRPSAKTLGNLHIFLKANPDCRVSLINELKKHARSKDFIMFHLHKMEKTGADHPNLTDELHNILDSIMSKRQALKQYQQTGWWTGDVKTAAVPSVVTSPASKLNTSRRSLQKNAAEGAPDNEPTIVSSRPKLTASDVEPLKQLLNMRRQQQ